MSSLRLAAIGLAGCLLALAAVSVRAQTAGAAPFADDERLVYRLLWPSGIPLGEAIFDVSSEDDELYFEVSVEAEIPEFRFNSTFSSVASRDELCSLQFHQKIQQGKQTSEESLEFDQEAHQVKRIQGPNTTTSEIPECARDPLTFLYYLRSRAAAGEKIESSSFHYGKDIALKLDQDGVATVEVGGMPRKGQKFEVRFPARGGQRTVEVWVSTDAARTPLKFTVPTSLADFKAELE